MDNKKASSSNVEVDKFITMCYTDLLPKLFADNKEEGYILSIQMLKLLGEEIAKRISTRTVRFDVTILSKQAEKTTTSDTATSTPSDIVVPNNRITSSGLVASGIMYASGRVVSGTTHASVDTKHSAAPPADQPVVQPTELPIVQPTELPIDLDAKFKSTVSTILDQPAEELTWLKDVNGDLVNELLTNEIYAKATELKQTATYYNKFHTILPSYIAEGEDVQSRIDYIVKDNSRETVESIRGFVESLPTDISNKREFLSNIFKRFPKFIARSTMADIGDYKNTTHDTFDGLKKYTTLETKYNEYAKYYDLPRWELSVVFERISEQLADYYIKLAIEQPKLFSEYKFDDWPLLKQATLKQLGGMYNDIHTRLYTDATAKALYKVFGLDVIRVFAETRHMYAIIAALSE